MSTQHAPFCKCSDPNCPAVAMMRKISAMPTNGDVWSIETVGVRFVCLMVMTVLNENHHSGGAGSAEAMDVDNLPPPGVGSR